MFTKFTMFTKFQSTISRAGLYCPVNMTKDRESTTKFCFCSRDEIFQGSALE